ncbi:DegT/DnrJ/EryC1/StrS family aminotransferase [Caulobacter segnis]|jgi:dTDP-4-amino-4,6-dideoxygalactose transaminase|uniref:DegT/DnrJ/EryC1/StrS family aminotransferase n=1 Tax=Caulobacter segnis TaxID=88688 RepID=UPI001CBBEE1D|nr:DegT/DnrJ/EryC1/StrS family aminotransferase [Caulobacter segnis]UAL11392.1 DegT/DnrJ/EryC1/StrS family aminotransferase [Caulobacter segnis]
MLPKPVATPINTLQGGAFVRAAQDVAPIDFQAVARALGAAGHASDLDQRLAARFARPVAIRAFADRIEATAAALRALGARAGGVCVVSALADPETLAGVAAAGLKAWLVDVDPFSAMFDTAHLRERLPEAPGPLEAIVPAAAHGRAPDMRAWAAFRAETGLPILVDAAGAFDVVIEAPVPVLVSLPAGAGVFVACEDATPVNAIDARPFAGDDGLAAWPGLRQRLCGMAQQLRVLLLDSGVGFQPGWGMSWISPTCALSLPTDDAGAVAWKLQAAGVPASCAVRDRALSADNTPVADRLAASTVVLTLDPNLDILALDHLCDALRDAVA